MFKKIFLFFFSILFSITSPSHALEKIIRVKVLSRYALEEVQVISSFSKMKVPAGNQIQEILLSPETPLILKAKGKKGVFDFIIELSNIGFGMFAFSKW